MGDSDASGQSADNKRKAEEGGARAYRIHSESPVPKLGRQSKTMSPGDQRLQGITAHADGVPCDVKEPVTMSSEEVKLLKKEVEEHAIHVNELVEKIADSVFREKSLQVTVNEREHMMNVLHTEVATQKISEEERREAYRASANLLQATNNTIREELKKERDSSHMDKLAAGLEADELRSSRARSRVLEQSVVRSVRKDESRKFRNRSRSTNEDCISRGRGEARDGRSRKREGPAESGNGDTGRGEQETGRGSRQGEC